MKRNSAKKSTKREAVKTTRESAVKTAKQRKTKRRKLYTYDTPVGVLTKDYGVMKDIPPETKLGDYFKSKGSDSMVRLLKML